MNLCVKKKWYNVLFWEQKRWDSPLLPTSVSFCTYKGSLDEVIGFLLKHSSSYGKMKITYLARSCSRAEDIFSSSVMRLSSRIFARFSRASSRLLLSCSFAASWKHFFKYPRRILPSCPLLGHPFSTLPLAFPNRYSFVWIEWPKMHHDWINRINISK